MTSRPNWQEVRLGDLVRIKHGWPFKSELFAEDLTGKPIVVAIGNFDYAGGFRFENTKTKEYRGDYPAEYELAQGEILLVMTCQTAGGEILGIPGRVPSDSRVYLHNQRLGRVIVTQPTMVDQGYLYQLFRWSEFNRALFLSASGTKILHTAPSRIEAFRFRLPPIAEQRAIAHILGSIDEKIDLNRRMNETLEAMARALFRSWFVDFDPVHAKAEGRQPAGMDGETAALFPSALAVSGQGAIPFGWRVSTIGEEVQVVGGSTPSTSDSAFWDGGTVHWATPKDLAPLNDSVLLDTERQITEQGLRQIGSGLLPQGTVLLSSRAPIGYLAISEIPVAINQGFIAMVCEKELPNFYILHWARSNMDTIVSRANGTTFLEVSKTNFRPMAVLVPTEAILTRFRQLVEPLYRKIVANFQESETLAIARDALLPRLMSGEVSIKSNIGLP